MHDEPTRRHILKTIAGGVIAGGTRSAFAQIPEDAGLGTIAAANGFTFGAAAGPVIFTDRPYRALYESQTKVITTDIALKMGTIAPRPGPKQFGSGDTLLEYCRKTSIPMRGHCLIWNEWVPTWIRHMSTAERRTYFDSYIDEVVTHYAGKLQSWDVVNEPFWPPHKAPGGFRVGPWYDAFGTDYIRRAYVRAQQADPHTKLVLNEAQTERDDDLGLAVRAGLLKLVAELKDAGVRLDVVGLQGHIQPRYPHDADKFQDFLHQLAGHGVDIYITEFDVRDDVYPDDIATRDAKVAAVAGNFLDKVLSVPAVKMVICWELADNYSFYRGIALRQDPHTTRLPRPLPYDDHYRPKPMWNAIADAFVRNTRKT